MEWGDGYVTSVEYVDSYFNDLSPACLKLAALNSGVAMKSDPNLRYLELGFGWGSSLNIHAAASEGEFWGTDFNPSHAEYAHEMARASGSNLRLFDLSFSNFAKRKDLPDFDVIVLHGVWSWITESNRRTIVEILQRRLAPGGLCFISYNCSAGSSAIVPIRDLMALYADVAVADDVGPICKMEEAIAFAQRMLDGDAEYFNAHPTARERLQSIAKGNRNYLVHEYFNRNFAPMTFSQASAMLGEAKLEYLCSANLLDHVDEINLSFPRLALLKGAKNVPLRESLRDVLLNRSFRRDIFVKGGRRMAASEHWSRYRDQNFVLLAQADAVPTSFGGALGDFRLQEAIYGPLLEMLAEDNFAPKSVGDLFDRPQWKGRTAAELVQALIILTGLMQAHPAPNKEPSSAIRRQCAALNKFLNQRARWSAAGSHLASPLIGAGTPISRFEQLFLTARTSGCAGPGEWAKFTWDVLASQGQRIIVNDAPLETPDENIAELTAGASLFLQKRLPVLEALGVA